MTFADDELSASLAEFAIEASRAEDVAATIHQIVGYGMKTIAADRGGITLWRRGGRLETIGATTRSSATPITGSTNWTRGRVSKPPGKPGWSPPPI
jgi:hypothetical protein